jgi:hypothetical protein
MIENPTIKNGLLSRKPLRLQTWWAFHRLTYFWRSEPNFLIAGVMKGGTTSLFHYLVQHPDVLPPFRKEIKYFGCNYFKGDAWYRAHFPLQQKLSDGIKLTGEASPYYIYHPTAHKRIADNLPQIKIIIILRNPAERAYSHHQHMVRVGREPLSFEDAIRAEPERLAGEAKKISLNPRYPTFKDIQYSYLSRGDYLPQIQRWHSLFPKEQILILRSEDLYHEPQAIMEETQAFLGLKTWHPKEYDIFKEGSYPPINPETRDKLVAHFEPKNKALYEYLDRDFGWK